jgi:hypothetical protein
MTERKLLGASSFLWSSYGNLGSGGYFWRETGSCWTCTSRNHRPPGITVNSRKKCMFLHQNTPKAISECPFGHLDGQAPRASSIYSPLSVQSDQKFRLNTCLRHFQNWSKMVRFRPSKISRSCGWPTGPNFISPKHPRTLTNPITISPRRTPLRGCARVESESAKFGALTPGVSNSTLALPGGVGRTGASAKAAQGAPLWATLSPGPKKAPCVCCCRA